MNSPSPKSTKKAQLPKSNRRLKKWFPRGNPSLNRKKDLPPTKPKNLDIRKREYFTDPEIKRFKAAILKLERISHRDWLLVTMMYRHALRVSEASDMRWEQVDLTRGRLHVNRLKNGDPSVHYLEGDEFRALRKLQREFPDSAFVFSSERQGPLAPRTIHAIIARAGEEAKLPFPIHSHMLRHSKGFQLAGRGKTLVPSKLTWGTRTSSTRCFIPSLNQQDSRDSVRALLRSFNIPWKEPLLPPGLLNTVKRLGQIS